VLESNGLRFIGAAGASFVEGANAAVPGMGTGLPEEASAGNFFDFREKKVGRQVRDVQFTCSICRSMGAFNRLSFGVSGNRA